MSDTLIIKITEGHDYKKLHALYWQYEAAYCEKWDVDYWIHGGPIWPWSYYEGVQENLKSWGKIELIAEALRQGYRYVAYMDGDSFICDQNVDIRWAFQETCNMVRWWNDSATSHLQAGNIYIQNHQTRDPKTEKQGLTFVQYLLQESKYYQTRMPGLRGWLEQGQINELALHEASKYLFYELDNRWNWCPNFCEPCDKPVVRSFHSMRGERLWNQMVKAIGIYYGNSKEMDDGKLKDDQDTDN